MKLSIITINYNNRDGLRKTIESVVAQTTREFEYIIIDGGSTDGSVDVIKEYANYIDYWVSEPDKGIYNAMNKGVAAAHGEYCQFLNSGDWLYSNITIELILPCLCENYDIIAGNAVLLYPNGECKENKQQIPEQLSSFYLIQRTLPHQSTFIKRASLIQRPYDESYKIIADWVFFFEAYLYDMVRFKRISINVVWYDMSGISNNCGLLFQKEKERFLRTVPLSDIAEELKIIPYYGAYPLSVIKYSFTFKNFLASVIHFLTAAYIAVKSTIFNCEYKDYPPQKTPIRKQLRKLKRQRNYKLLR